MHVLPRAQAAVPLFDVKDAGASHPNRCAPIARRYGDETEAARVRATGSPAHLEVVGRADTAVLSSKAMDLRHLEQIVAVCNSGGLSGAARQLRISQPTLSKSISRLESQLSVQLFDRSGGAARPTKYGQFFADRAKDLLAGVNELTRDFEQLRGQEVGRLRIGAGSAVQTLLLPQIIQRMSDEFPNLNLKTGVEHGPALIRAMLDGRYDVVFVYYGAAAAYGDLIRTKIFEDQYVAVVRPDHPALQSDTIGPAELLRYRIAACTLIPSLREWIGDLSSEQAERLKGFVTDSYDLIRERVLTSDFVAIVPRLIFREDFAAGSLVQLPLTWQGHYECWMLTTPHNWRSPRIKVLADFAKEGAKRMLARSAQA
jgi:DNA-binding transcriptional LysR family regulator